jgi:hypothetical protein
MDREEALSRSLWDIFEVPQNKVCLHLESWDCRFFYSYCTSHTKHSVMFPVKGSLTRNRSLRFPARGIGIMNAIPLFILKSPGLNLLYSRAHDCQAKGRRFISRLEQFLNLHFTHSHSWVFWVTKEWSREGVTLNPKHGEKSRKVTHMEVSSPFPRKVQSA